MANLLSLYLLFFIPVIVKNIYLFVCVISPKTVYLPRNIL